MRGGSDCELADRAPDDAGGTVGSRRTRCSVVSSVIRGVSDQGTH